MFSKFEKCSLSFTRDAGLGCLLLLSPALCLSAYADVNIDKDGNPYLVTGTVKNGVLTISGNTSSDAVPAQHDEEIYGNIYGAMAQANTDELQKETFHTADASKNNITFTGFLKSYYLVGALADPTAYSSTGKVKSTTDYNTVRITGGDNYRSFGALSYIGVETDNGSTYTAEASASHNRFDITDGSQNAAAGGIAMVCDGVKGATITSISADGNTLALHGGTYDLEKNIDGGDEIEEDGFDQIGIAAAVILLQGEDVKLEKVSASNNTLVLAAGSDGKAPEFKGNVVLCGSKIIGDASGAASVETGGNTLAVDSVKGVTAYNIENFSKFEFMLPDMKANETVLTLTDPSGTDIKASTKETLSFGVTKVGNLYGADGGEFKSGDKVILLKNEKGLTVADKYDTSVTGQTGVSLNYELKIEKDDQSLYLVRTGGSVNKGTKAIAEGAAAGSALINAGSDAVIAALGSMGSFMNAQTGSSASSGQGAAGNVATGGSIFAFGYAQGSSVRHETGSHINMNAVSLVAGLGTGVETGAGRLGVGAFFEYGRGSYTTSNSFDDRSDIDGDGTSWYMGGGLMARMDFIPTGPGHFYVEGSAHMGQMHNEYESSDIRDANGRATEFDMDSPYFTLHGGLGYVWNVAEGHDLDVYGKYIWTRVQGTDETLSTGDKFEFDDMNSYRLRLGARYSYKGNEHFQPYIGAAWEHEFGGSCDSTAYGHPVAAPSFEGDTGIGEIGVTLIPSSSVPISISLGVEGYVGKKQGGAGNCVIMYEF